MDPGGGPRRQEHTLRADSADQQRLLDLQAQDSTLARLRHRRDTLPETQRLAELTARATELNGRRVEAETAVSDLAREQARADAEVEQVRARKTRDEERMASGAISSPKDLTSMEHELGALTRRIATLEDAELEVMERLEEVQTRRDEVGAELDAVRAEMERARTAWDEATGAIDAEADTARSEREAVVRTLPTDLLELYVKVRDQYGGLGAAALRSRRCEGCRLELNGADLREIAAQDPDEVLRCPECSRILVRTAESGL